MKKSIILLLGLVLLFAIPTLASTPTNENAPAQTSEDQQFLDLLIISTDELIELDGGYHFAMSDTTTGGGPIINKPDPYPDEDAPLPPDDPLLPPNG